MPLQMMGGHAPAKAGDHCENDHAMSADGRDPEWTGIVAPVITVPAPCRGATKAKAKDKKPNYNTFESVERWIWDTGSGVDICGQEHAPTDGTGLVRPASEMLFHTANGTVSAGPVYPGLLRPFDEAIAPHILESTPPLLTVGKRCMTKGYGFFWFPMKGPLRGQTR